MKARNLILTTILCTGLAFPAIASDNTVDQRIQQLEYELAQLKKMVTEQAKVQAATPTPAATPAPATKASGTTYKFGGFIKATASLSDYSSGDLAAGSGGRDFYIPGTIPVGGTAEGTNDFDFSAKETRINFKSNTVLDNGSKLGSFIEMDFLLPPGGNERVSNSYNPRLRHAFLTYNNWLFGQTWSTFQNTGALPESVDFLGASEGIIFERQPMVRYTNGPWQFAVENPETTITPFGGGGRIVSDDGAMPDLVARYNFKGARSNVSVAAIARSLAYENTGSAIDDTASGFGVSLTGKFMVGANDDIRFNINSGSGMGRYAGLNTANGAVLDASGNLEAIDSTSGAIAYRHVWNSMWRSNLIYSTFSADNDTALTGTGVTSKVSSYQLNLLYSPAPKLTLGVGYLGANRELESGVDGDLDRLIFTAKYGF